MKVFAVVLMCGIILVSCATRSVVEEETFSDVKEVEMTREEFEDLFGEKEEEIVTEKIDDRVCP